MSGNVPYSRWASFAVFNNPDGQTFHVLVIDDSGGRIFADGFISREDAEWACELCNAEIGGGLTQ